MKTKEKILTEWYETGCLGGREEVFSSNMPAEFQQMRQAHQETPSPEVNMEVEVIKQDETPQDAPEEPVNAQQDVDKPNPVGNLFAKSNAFYDLLRSYDDALRNNADTAELKERLKSAAVEVMRLTDGI